MKKNLLFVLALSAFVNLTAQKKIDFGQKLSTEKATKMLKKKPSISESFRAKNMNNMFAQNDGTSVFKNNKSEQSIVPSSTIVSKTWGQLKNVDTDEWLTFQQSFKYGAGANVEMKLLDENLAVSKEFTFNIPTTANGVYVLNTVSSKIIDNSTDLKFLVYIHYFEGGSGPEFQKDGIWVVNDKGEILNKMEGAGATFVPNNSGSVDLFAFTDNDEVVTVNALNYDLSQKSTYSFPSVLTYNLVGSPLSFMKVKGENKIVIAHYEKLFLNNDTFEVTPDNNLLVKILNRDLVEEKTIPLDITSSYPEEPFTFGLGNFGVFYFNYKYDVSDKIFNNDEDLEIVYGITYEDLMADNSWTHYYVANEQGTRLKSFETNVISGTEMMSIPGQDDQIGLILGEGESGTGIQMFDINSWTPKFEFPAVYNDEQLASDYNRVPSANGYSYLISMASGIQENGKTYGVINRYTADGAFEKAIKLDIGVDPQLFIAVLNSDSLNPHIFNNDDDIEYTYVHKHKFPTGNKIYNEFTIAKETGPAIFTAKGDKPYGDVTASGFLFTKNGASFNKLALVYNNYEEFITTEFYDLPFSVLATNNTSVNTTKIYTDRLNKTINWSEKANTYEVYGMAGDMLLKGNNADKASTSTLLKGAYVLKLSTDKGVVTKKFMID